MTALHDLIHPIPQAMINAQQGSTSTPAALCESLNNLQGNILHAHRRKYAVHIFLQFKAGKKTAVKEWIKAHAEQITSARQQLDETKENRGLFRSFFLSASGYKYLGLDFPRTSPPFDDRAFPSGMKKARRKLHDPAPESWDSEYQQDIHAMVLLAHDTKQELLQERDRWLDNLKAHADVGAVEQGRVLRNAQGKHIEHFGYVDGRSHPLFFESDIEREMQRGGIDVWNPSAGLATVLVPDPYGRRGRDHNGLVTYHDSGSYLVFRKLEQNVDAFKAYEQELANALDIPEDEVTRAGALLVGRFEDGTPLVSQQIASQPKFALNNFTYDNDLDGQKCPFQAHIRKVNPRRKEGWRPLIVRRGITYGKRQRSLDDRPSQGVGILFMCYQRNIQEHFEYLQSHWANNPHFPREGIGIDPIIGQADDTGIGQHQWPAEWDDPRDRHRLFELPQRRLVTLKGGEYFFAPSKHFLRFLGED